MVDCVVRKDVLLCDKALTVGQSHLFVALQSKFILFFLVSGSLISGSLISDSLTSGSLVSGSLMELIPVSGPLVRSKQYKNPLSSASKPDIKQST